MTDRYVTLTVYLDNPIRTDDLEPLMSAIRMLNGVRDVDHGVIQDANVVWQTEHAKDELRNEIVKKLWPHYTKD